MQKAAGPHDVIVIAPDYLAPTFNWYYKGNLPQVTFPWGIGRLEWPDYYELAERWQRAAEAVPATLDAVEARLGSDGRLWLVAAPTEYPHEETYFGQVRRLKQELDTRYRLERAITHYRYAPEWADIYVYSRRL